MLPFSHTDAPPGGAGPVSVSVPVVVPPPVMLLLASDKDARLGAGAGLPAGMRFSQFSGARYPSKAVPQSMTTRVGTETGAVAMLNVAPIPPAGIKTFPGVAASDVSLLTIVTSTPPGGAGFKSVTVPMTVSPPITASSLSERL